jgi:Arc/MetJ-type ribon-helix-helix transcriptional regulator
MATIQAVSLDSDLYNEVKNFKSAGQYKTDSEVISKLIRVAVDYLKEQAEDEYLLALALEREKNGSGVFYSMGEVMERHGISEEDLENSEEDEFE